MVLKNYLTIILCLFVSAFAWSQANWTDKVNPQLLEEARTKANVEFIVFLHENADVSQAKLLKNKADKGRYVHKKLVETAKRTQGNMIEVFESFDAPYTTYNIVNSAWAVGNIQLIEALAKLPEINSIQFNAKFKIPDLIEIEESANQVESRGIEWGVENIQAPEVWAMGYTGQNVVVAGADTGYKWDHETLKKKYRGWDDQAGTADHDYNWHDAIHNVDDPTNPCPPDSDTPCDGHNHGTHTMGTMVGDDENGNQIGVAPGATWIGCKNMVTLGVGYLDTYMECIEWFAAPYPVGGSPGSEDCKPEFAPDVINNSWACVEGCTDAAGIFIPIVLESMEMAINRLRDCGVVFVGSAGNDGLAGCNTIAFPPAFFEATFTVGASDINNNIAGFSSRGNVTVDLSNRMKPNVSAPGVNVRSALKDGTYGNFSGTSMAGPHVAGAVALLISSNPNLKGEVDMIQDIFEASARGETTPSNEGCGSEDSSADTPNNVFGHGIIDMVDAVNMAMALPIDLIDFYGVLNQGKVDLTWLTASEKDNDYFDIQRSNDLQNWRTIGKVDGKNSSNETLKYNFTDHTPQVGTNYYRLNQVDNSGAATISKAIVIEVTEQQSTIATLYPNPSKGQVNIRLNDADLLLKTDLNISVFNSLGQLEQRQVIKDNEETLELPAGIHFYLISDKHKNVLQEGKLIVE